MPGLATEVRSKPRDFPQVLHRHVVVAEHLELRVGQVDAFVEFHDALAYVDFFVLVREEEHLVRNDSVLKQRQWTATSLQQSLLDGFQKPHLVENGRRK